MTRTVDHAVIDAQVEFHVLMEHAPVRVVLPTHAVIDAWTCRLTITTVAHVALDALLMHHAMLECVPVLVAIQCAMIDV